MPVPDRAACGGLPLLRLLGSEGFWYGVRLPKGRLRFRNFEVGGSDQRRLHALFASCIAWELGFVHKMLGGFAIPTWLETFGGFAIQTSLEALGGFAIPTLLETLGGFAVRNIA